MNTTERTEATSELVSLISGIKRSLQGRTYRCKDGAELTSGQLGMLFTLKQHGPTSAQDVAARLAMTPGAVSQLVDGLFDAGYIVRSPRNDDRRVVDLSLSARGQEQISGIEHKRHAFIKQMTDGLSDDELTQLVSALRKMLDVLQQHNNK
ncbi:MarR family transcriptional regulator [Candidatus Saccharibacteria bacterium]|nr:MarR family transcriptional regulator [Candidatus Saccharibacteria bacterium]